MQMREEVSPPEDISLEYFKIKIVVGLLLLHKFEH